jgi:hypothetical protein
MILTNEQQGRIQLGAALLDEKRPDWYTGINLETLDINSFSTCPLCQTFDDYWEACEILKLDPENSSEENPMKACDYGFYPHPTDNDPMAKDGKDIEAWGEEFAKAKTAFWKELILKRRGAHS